MSLHARETPNDGLHGPYAWIFADATARAAFTVTSGWPTSESDLTADDLNKWALDLDTGDAYRLVSLGPTTWMVGAIATGGGNVSGPGTSTDNAVARFNGTDGELIQNSGVIIDDSNNITGAGTINGVSITAHGSRHGATAADPVPTATAVELTDSTNAEGSGNELARASHTHAHGTRGGGTLHAAATTSVAGFMAAADKTKVDLIETGVTVQTWLNLDADARNGDADTGINVFPGLILRDAAQGIARWALPPIPAWQSGDVSVRVIWTGNSTGSAGNGVRWGFSYNYHTLGNTFGTFTDVESTEDASGVVIDQSRQYTIGTIPSATVSAGQSATILFFRLYRLGADGADTYPNDVFVHRVVLEYTGRRFTPTILRW